MAKTRLICENEGTRALGMEFESETREMDPQPTPPPGWNVATQGEYPVQFEKIVLLGLHRVEIDADGSFEIADEDCIGKPAEVLARVLELDKVRKASSKTDEAAWAKANREAEEAEAAAEAESAGE